jgi:hypothetical protein
MKRRFTGANVLETLRQWPQAVSADEGDLRVLHDMANAGAQIWSQKLPWPDYLWLDFENKLPECAVANTRKEVYQIQAPTRTAPDATFSLTQRSSDRSEFPPSGTYSVTNRVIAMLEVKVINADLVTKLTSYRPTIPWPRFLRLKLDQWFGDRLREADKQIAGGKRLLPFTDARGIAVIVNEASPQLRSELVMGYLADAISTYRNLHGVLYLSDAITKPHKVALIVKDQNDQTLTRFLTQALMMFGGFNYDGDLPVSRAGPHPQLVTRIEMDQQNRSMYRSWATGWRRADDKTPVPAPAARITFVRREEFVSGLAPTAPDPRLLDCRLRWDPDGTNLRVDNG